jgi:sec-independent protein translocase protein TatC
MAENSFTWVADESEDEATNGKMGFLEHLDELRTRLIRSCVAIAAGMLVAFAFVDRISDFVLAPTLACCRAGGSLIMTRAWRRAVVLSGSRAHRRRGAAAPFVHLSSLAFHRAGTLRPREAVDDPVQSSLTLLGTLSERSSATTSFFPSMMSFFRTFDSPHMRFMPRVEDTFELYKKRPDRMVAVFQNSDVVFVLARMQLVTAPIPAGGTSSTRS